MADAPITVKLRCSSWKQLKSIHTRDLLRSSFFLKTTNPPPIGTRVRINLTLPSDSVVIFTGTIRAHVAPGGLEGRGPGIDIGLDGVPHTAMWLIESALASSSSELSGVRTVPPASANQAVRQASTSPAPPSLDDGEELLAAESDLIRALWQELESLGRMNPFQILNIGSDSGDDAVRSAFGELSRKYHPDRFSRYESDEVKHLANEIFIVVRDAYKKIGDDAGRARVRSSFRLTPDSPMSQPPPIADRAAHRPAERANKTPTPIDSAPLAAGSAPATSPSTPAPATPDSDAANRVAIALRLLDSGDYERALTMFRIEQRKDGANPSARVGVELAEGLRSLAQGDRMEAAQRFEAVLEIDPANERAARELANLRRQAVTQRRGLLSRLMGKQE